jgi:hypothetical protein
MWLAWRHEGVIEYLSFGSVDMVWNLMDLGGIAAGYVACAMHFTSDAYSGDMAHGVQQAGALAILLNSLSLLQVMRPFDGTVSHAEPSCGFQHVLTRRLLLTQLTCDLFVGTAHQNHHRDRLRAATLPHHHSGAADGFQLCIRCLHAGQCRV